MEIKNSTIIPYKGFSDIDLSMSPQEVINLLETNKIVYSRHERPKGGDPVAWDIINIGEDVNIYFAKNTMFGIVFKNSYSGKLSNGICLGMTMEEALKLDPTLTFDDDDEIYESNQGYWLDESLVSGKIYAITIFIKEVLNENLFYSYTWAK